MQLISLNIWGGRVHVPLVSFLQKYAESTDVFCFQEVHDNPPKPLEDDTESMADFFGQLLVILPNHIGYFAPQIPGIGMAVFVTKNIVIESMTYTTILKTEEMSEKFIPRVLQKTVLHNPKMSIYNFHGVPKSNKLDTPERYIQTTRLLEEIEKD